MIKVNTETRFEKETVDFVYKPLEYFKEAILINKEDIRKKVPSPQINTLTQMKKPRKPLLINGERLTIFWTTTLTAKLQTRVTKCRIFPYSGTIEICEIEQLF